MQVRLRTYICGGGDDNEQKLRFNMMTIPEEQVPKVQGSFHFRLFQVFLHLLLIFHLTELLPGLYKGFKSVGDFTVLRSVSKVSL